MKTVEEEFLDYASDRVEECRANDSISDDLFKKYDVKRGLRDINGKGVLTGLTRVSEVNAYHTHNGERDGDDGELWYRGYRVNTLIDSLGPHEMGYEKIAYLLMFGDLPDEEHYREFRETLANQRTLPTNFTRDVIMKAPTSDIMNSMTRSILTLASYDESLQDTSLANNIRQCMMLIAVFPMLAVYSYHADNHYNRDQSMYIHRPDPEYSTAQNFLRMLRPDNEFTEIEAKSLDAALILHMEHGGGNNSTFTTRVVTSSGSDTYSAIAAAMSSLKGPKHGGANIKVMKMMENIRENLGNTPDRGALKDYLADMLDGKVFDHKGLIYGMGHAIYAKSDPREKILKKYCEKLSDEKKRYEDMDLYENIEEIAPEIISEKRHMYKGVCPNVDFYSGFVYQMLDIPVELYTPLFAIARIVGWSSHRIEELIGEGKIIRPAYKSVMEHKEP
ncbi:MAG: citrate/2-methylcitrate synthase [Anaerovoracaceae bacterium]